MLLLPRMRESQGRKEVFPMVYNKIYSVFAAINYRDGRDIISLLRNPLKIQHKGVLQRNFAIHLVTS